MPKVAHFGEEEPEVPREVEVNNRILGDDQDDKAVAKKSKLTVKAMLAPWMAGASYAELAELFEFPSAASARHAIERALAEAAPDGPNDRSMLVSKVSMTLDRCLRAVMPKAIDPNNPDQRAYMDSVLKVLDRKVALHGLNAPSTLVIGTPDDDELQSFIAQLAVASGSATPEEADPFVEMVEDPETGEWTAA